MYDYKYLAKHLCVSSTKDVTEKTNADESEKQTNKIIDGIIDDFKNVPIYNILKDDE